MSKTLQAIDDLFSTAVSLIPTWLSMLKSTRFLTLIGTLVLIYITWKYGGLTENQMLAVTAIEAATGISFTGFKTLRPSQMAPTPLIESPLPQPVEAKPIASTVTYNTPVVVDEYVKAQGGTLYEQFDAVQKLIRSYNLLKIHPDIRVTVAEQVVDKAVSLARSAWPTIVGTGSDGKEHYRVPEASDFRDYDTRQLYEKAVRDSIPGCQYTPEGAKIMIDDLEELYKFRSNLTLLEGKPVRWYEPDGRTPRINCVYTLSDLGLSAVA